MSQTIPLLGEEPLNVKPDEADQRYWSVTTILDALNKPALVPWAAIKTAESAVDDVDIWERIAERQGRAEAIKWLKDSRYRRKGRSATQMGTDVHKAIEWKAIHGRYRDEDKADMELRPYLEQANRFLKDFKPKYEAAEITVYSPSWGYAGTSDGIIELEGQRYIIDYKTSAESTDSKGKPKSPYPEVALQLAAYRYAEIAAVWRSRTEEGQKRYYLLNDTERALAVPMPKVDHGLAILITPESYSVHPVRCDEEVHETFLHTIEVARFAFLTARDVVGSPLVAPAAFQPQGDPFVGLPK